MTIRLYRARFSTNVERVALTLALKGLEAESIWITYDDRGVVERVSGQGLVPVLDYDGEIVTESMDIVRFLDERHPSEPPLYPVGEPDRLRQILVFIDWFNAGWKKKPNGIEEELGKDSPDQTVIDTHARGMIESLDEFEEMLAGGAFLFGDTLTAADICAFPFLKYATLHDPEDTELFHMILRDRQRDGRHRPRLNRWIARMDTLPRA